MGEGEREDVRERGQKEREHEGDGFIKRERESKCLREKELGESKRVI